MTGWRIGFIAAPLPISQGLLQTPEPVHLQSVVVAQKAAEAAYLGPQDCVEEMRKAFERRRDLVVSLAREIPGLKVNCPQGAFYLFPEVSSYLGKSFNGKTIATDSDLAMYLSKRDTWPQWPDRPSASRDTYALAMRLPTITSVEAMRRIAEALSRLK